MKPHQYALALVMGVFMLLLGAFTVLKTARSIIDALKDTGSILELAAKTWTEAPIWAVGLIVVGLANLLSIWVWPWLQQQIAGKAIADTEPSETHAELFPDWPIQELFFRLDPKILNEPNQANWEVIGRVLIDNLSIGRLRSWGRRYLGSLEATERNSTLVEIPSEYWMKGGDLSYMFFSERYAYHTYPPSPSDLPQYADMQLSKAQALGVAWPKLEACGTDQADRAAPRHEPSRASRH
jgi:hypothetical protein